MLEGYKADYKPAPKGATRLEKNQIGIIKKEAVAAGAGSGPAGAEPAGTK